MSIKGFTLFLGMNNTKLEGKNTEIVNFENEFLPTYLLLCGVECGGKCKNDCAFYSLRFLRNKCGETDLL